MKEFSFKVPQNIVFGEGSIRKLPELLKESGCTNVLIISGPRLRKMGKVDEVAGYVKESGIGCDMFTDVEGNPSVDTVDKAAAKYREMKADGIVAFGGGSPMDVAKAVALVAKYGGSITEYEGGDKVPGPVDTIIAIPTTAGTGSEVTTFSVITDHTRNYKLSVFRIFEKAVILVFTGVTAFLIFTRGKKGAFFHFTRASILCYAPSRKGGILCGQKKQKTE